MASKFRFQLLTGTDPDAQYGAITNYDPYCFYLLQNGKGYLGSTQLFGSGGGLSNSGIQVMNGGTLTSPQAGVLYIMKEVTYGTDVYSGMYMSDGTNLTSFSDSMIEKYLLSKLCTSLDIKKEGWTESDDDLITSKAVTTLIKQEINSADIMNTKFFRLVEFHTITDADIQNSNIVKPTGTAVGDVGILFTADTNSTDDGDETKYFISLKDYLSATYSFTNSNSITFTETEGENGAKQVTAELKVAATEKAISVTENGVSLKRFNENDLDVKDGDGSTEYGPEPDPDKIVTEKAMVKYVQDKVLTAVSEAITEALSDVVTWDEDPKQQSSETGGGGAVIVQRPTVSQGITT